MWCDPKYRQLYCKKNLPDNRLPRCPLLEQVFNDTVISFDDIYYPTTWAKPPEPQSHQEYKLQAIEGLTRVLNWWVTEKPNDPRLLCFYAYSYGPCKLRAIVAGGGNTISDLITEFNYSHPAIVAELKDLWHSLNTKAIEWDELARGLQQSQCWIDPHRLDPVRVKEAAAQLLHKLQIAGSLVKEEQKAGNGEKLKQPSKLALEAYRLVLITGIRQTEAAEMLSNEHNRNISQGQVSKWVNKVKEYVKAGNILPDVPIDDSRATVKPVAPRKLDYQEKPDGRNRPRKSPLQYDGDE